MTSTRPEITPDTDDPIYATTSAMISPQSPRPTSEGQPEYRARAEATNRTAHTHSNNGRGTPRHPDPMGRRARWRGRAAVIDSAFPAKSTTTAAARSVASC